MAGVIANGKQKRGQAEPTQIARVQRPLIGRQHPGQPAQNCNQIEITQMDQQRVAKLKGQRGKNRRGWRDTGRPSAQRSVRNST